MAFLGLIKWATRISRNNSRVRVYPARYFQSRDLSNTNFFHVEDAKLPVLIVGAGPVGLVLSILLTKLDFEKVVSPASVAHFSQYKLTSLILKRLEDLGFDVQTFIESDGLELDSVVAEKILMGHECVAIDANKESVAATVSFVKGGKHMKRNIQCSILVGADGAGSVVRRLTKVGMRGERDLQKLISVHLMSRELGEYLINNTPGMLCFIFNTGGIGVLVAHDLLQGEFVLQIPYYPPQQSLSDFNPEMCKILIFNLVGHELSDLDVADIKPWVMHAEVA